jgi:hypothetical protein
MEDDPDMLGWDDDVAADQAELQRHAPKRPRSADDADAAASAAALLHSAQSEFGGPSADSGDDLFDAAGDDPMEYEDGGGGESRLVRRRRTGGEYEDDEGEEGEEGEDEISLESDGAAPLADWMLGKNIFELPPSSSDDAVAGAICNWHPEHEGKLRAVRAMCFNRPLEFRDASDDSMLAYRSFADPGINNRSAAMAAVEGMCADYAKKGHYIPGSGTILKEPLPEDEGKKRAAEAKLRIDQYLYEYRFRSVPNENGSIDPDAPRVREEENLPDSKLYKYSAFSQQLFVEPLYAPAPEGSDEEHGACVGTRLWVLVFNPRHSTMAHMLKIMEENTSMQKCGRAGSCPNEARGNSSNGPERAARQQRAFCANPDVNKFGVTKYMSITNVGSFCDRIHQAAGQDSGGEIRTPLGSMEDMRRAVGARAMDRAFTADPLLDSKCAISPIFLFNARRNGNPPANLFPEDNPKWKHYARSEKPEEAFNPALQAFMVTSDGMPIDICRRQVNPNSYYDDDGCVRFPFEASYIARATDSFSDSNMPLRLPMGIPMGDAALECYYECENL